jgi:mevalonate kinase
MDKFVASAPGRVFLSGEAAFELGAKALLLPAESGAKRNIAALSVQETPGKFVAYSGAQMATMMTNGRVKGDDELKPYLLAARDALCAAGQSLEAADTSFSLSLEPSFPLSAGLSASLCAAVFSGIFSYYAKKDDAPAAFLKSFLTSGRDCFLDADALLMAAGCALVAERAFLLDGSTSVVSKKAQARLPEGTALLYAEPQNAADRRGEMAGRLASYGGAGRTQGRPKTALQMTEDERAKATDGFSALTKRILAELSAQSPSPEKAAIYLECEHEMLSAAGAVDDRCQKAAAAAKKAGALAAKASGFSGGVLALCYEDAADGVADALSLSSLQVCGPITVSARGMDCVPA